MSTVRGATERVSTMLSLIAVASGVVARIALFPLHPNLWEDEIIATTHAVQPLGHFFVNVARNDIHPPLYFLQLHFWGLVSHADAWFVANSVAWSFGALVSLWFVVRREGGNERLAWAAAGILAVLPTSLEMAFIVRMYAMLSVMMIWGYHFTGLAFGDGKQRRWWPLALINAALIYTHAVGFLAVLFNSFYGLALLFRRRAPRRDYWIWLAQFGGVAVLALPVLLGDVLHDANLGAMSGLGVALSWIAISVVGANAVGGVAWIGAGLVLFLVIAIFGLRDVRTRPLVASYVIAPLLLAVFLGLVLKPIYKADFFSTVLSPFVALSLAHLIAGTPGASLRGAAYACLTLALGGMALNQNSVDTKSTNFAAAASVIRANAQTGDIVAIPQVSMFWGMAWNLAGPDWGSPLAVAPEPSAPWRRVYRLLGPNLVQRLGLMPQTQSLAAGKVTLMVGRDALAEARSAPRLWIVAYPRADLPLHAFDITQGGLVRHAEWRFGYGGRLSVALYEKDQQPSR